MNMHGVDGLITKVGLLISLGIWAYGAIVSTNVETAVMYGVLGTIGIFATLVIEH